MLARVGRFPHMHPLHLKRSSAQSLFCLGIRRQVRSLFEPGRAASEMWFICGIWHFFFTSRMPFLTQNPPLSSRLGTGTHFRWIAVHEAEIYSKIFSPLAHLVLKLFKSELRESVNVANSREYPRNFKNL